MVGGACGARLMKCPCTQGPFGFGAAGRLKNAEARASYGNTTPMIRDLLEAHYRRPYPAGGHTPVGNVDLEMLDADVAALASHYLDHHTLTEHQLPIMRGCLGEAERVLPLLEGEAGAYFAGVRDLAAAVIADIDRERAV